MFIRMTLVLAFFLSSVALARADFKLVRELHPISPWPGMAFVGDKLYTSDTDKDYKQTVEIYSADGETHLKTFTLKHSVTHLASYGDKGVIAVGRTSDPWRSHMTIITDRNGNFSAKHYILSSINTMESSASDGNNIYFNEKGTRGIFKFNGRGLTKLPVEISGPGKNMQFIDGRLYVVELRDLFSYGDESIVEIDTGSNRAKRLIDNAQLYGLRNIAWVDGMIAGTETYNNHVVFVDLHSNKIIGRHEVKAGVYGIAAYGKCAVAVSDETKTLTFLRVEDDGVKIVGGWDLNPAGDRLKQPRSLAVDHETGRIFVRSNYVCNSCPVTQSSVFSFDDGGEILGKCQ